MSLTTPAVHFPSSEAPGSWLRRHLGWILTGLAVAAAAVLVTLVVVDSGSGSTTVPAPDLTVVDRQDTTGLGVGRDSISAIDHRLTTGATAGRFEVGRDSISAIDRRDAVEGDSSTAGGRIGGPPVR